MNARKSGWSFGVVIARAPNGLERCKSLLRRRLGDAGADDRFVLVERSEVRHTTVGFADHAHEGIVAHRAIPGQDSEAIVAQPDL
jgi:hypothetical protein